MAAPLLPNPSRRERFIAGPAGFRQEAAAVHLAFPKKTPIATAVNGPGIGDARSVIRRFPYRRTV